MDPTTGRFCSAIPRPEGLGRGGGECGSGGEHGGVVLGVSGQGALEEREEFGVGGKRGERWGQGRGGTEGEGGGGGRE